MRRTHNIQSLINRHIHAIWISIFVIFIVGFVLGFIGFMTSPTLYKTGSTTVDVFDALYATIKLIKLGDLSVAAANPLVIIGRFLLPLAVSLTALFGLFTFLRTCANRLHAHNFRGHTIVCGLGERGSAFIQDAIRAYEGGKRESLKIVAVEKDPQNPFIKICQNEGITVYVGDARKPDLLSMTRPEYARDIFCFLHEDGDNIALINTIATILETRNYHEKDLLKCHVSFDNLLLHQQFMGRRLLGRSGELPVECDFVYSQEYLSQCAITRGILKILCSNPQLKSISPDETPVFTLIGAGFIGREIIRNIAKLCHLRNEVSLQNPVEYHTPSIIHAIDNNEENLKRIFKENLMLDPKGQFNGAMDAYSVAAQERAHVSAAVNESAVLPLPDINVHIDDLEVVSRIEKIAYDILSWNTSVVFVALGNDSLSVSTALALQYAVSSILQHTPQKHIPEIRVYYRKYGGFDHLFGTSCTDKLKLDYPPIAGITDTNELVQVRSLCDWSVYSFDSDSTMDLTESIAISTNACYTRVDQNRAGDIHTDKKLDTDVYESTTRRKEGTYTALDYADITDDQYEAAKTDFRKRPFIQQLQNYNQVYHNIIKLSQVGHVISKDDLQSDTLRCKLETNMELLARLEHQRWWSEQLMGGWHYGSEKRVSSRSHPDLVPFEHLIQSKKADITAVRGMVPALAYNADKIATLSELFLQK